MIKIVAKLLIRRLNTFGGKLGQVVILGPIVIHIKMLRLYKPPFKILILYTVLTE